MTGGLDNFVAPGRHTRRPGRAGLRRVCLATLIMLVVQYGVGIFLNLYVPVPASDANAGILKEIATAPLALTVHALLGLALTGTAILLVIRAVSVGDRLLAVLTAVGLTGIGGAFAAGEIFVRNGMAFASLAMGVLTGVALLCYVGTLALATAAQWQATERQATERQVTEQQASRPPMHPARDVPYAAPWPAATAPGFAAQESWHITSPAQAQATWFAQD